MAQQNVSNQMQKVGQRKPVDATSAKTVMSKSLQSGNPISFQL